MLLAHNSLCVHGSVGNTVLPGPENSGFEPDIRVLGHARVWFCGAAPKGGSPSEVPAFRELLS